MKIRHVSIRRFRGIRELDWDVASDMVCLIGPCDSGKSTILQAIELALLPRWTAAFCDDDFYQSDPSEPIEIRVTLVDVPKDLLGVTAFGLYARGWRQQEPHLADEPDDSAAIALTVQLKVDESLEPVWQVVTDRHDEGKAISAAQRAKLGVASLGTYLDREFSWSRGSTLSRISSGGGAPEALFAQVSRSVRAQVNAAQLQDLHTSARRLSAEARQAGIAVRDDFCVGLDLRSFGLSSSALCLFDGTVPLHQGGLGTRRLVALVMQRQLTDAGAILLVDELEHGLEPVRVRQLVRYLRPTKVDKHQVFTSTHSAVALVEHMASEIHVVRSVDGCVTVTQAAPGLQGALRALQEAFFCRKVILCEGSTEWGLSRALEQAWVGNGNDHLAYAGAAFAYAPGGSGSTMAGYARDVVRLGYQVALWGDSDRDLSPSPEELRALGVKVFLWADGCSTEVRLCNDLPFDALEEVVRDAERLKGHQSVHDAIGAQLGCATLKFSTLAELRQQGVSEDQLRNALGEAAQKHKWFKATNGGQRLGAVACRYLHQIPHSETAGTISALEKWVYG